MLETSASEMADLCNAPMRVERGILDGCGLLQTSGKHHGHCSYYSTLLYINSRSLLIHSYTD